MKTCLVVDDSRVIRKVARRILEDIGFYIAEASDGAEALTWCRSAMPEAILLDWNMPVMNGFEFLQGVRANASTARTPVLMLTTETRDELKVQGKALGLTGWVVKPFNPAQLKQAISRVLRLA